MLHDPARHEPLRPIAWDPERARAAIATIVDATVRDFRPGAGWALHPNDAVPDEDPAVPATPLYHGAAGVIWALHYLQDAGLTPGAPRLAGELPALIERNAAWLASFSGADESAAYLCGETPLRMMQLGEDPSDAAIADRLAALIDGNLDHPARELMWGSPGTLLAAWMMHRREGVAGAESRWAGAFGRTARRLWHQLEASEAFGCRTWSQDLYGRHSHYLDGVHGFVATAGALIRGRALLPADEWAAWETVIAETIERTAVREGGGANWPAQLPASRDEPPRPMLMQFCHGSPGFVIWLAPLPLPALDALLLEAGEATWAAGPLTKGSNLCHGTGGNGYAFLALHARTGDPRWLERARAFAMHGIAQTEGDAARFGRHRHSLWTGDIGFAIYLGDCLRGEGAFPTVDVFDAPSPRAR